MGLPFLFWRIPSVAYIFFLLISKILIFMGLQSRRRRGPCKILNQNDLFVKY